MGITTVPIVESALGRTLTPTEATQCEYYIEFISAFVETYTGTTFTLQEDVALKMQSDHYGIIDLPMKPIVEVTDVINDPSIVPAIDLALTEPFWGYDGYGSIYNLAPEAAYQVTLTYGYTTPPTDIQGYVTQAVVGVINNPTGLASFRVGDVTESYTGVSSGGQMTVAQMGQYVLDSYKDTEETWRLGPRTFNQNPTLPIL